jgi:predicted ferric reductase
MAFANLPVLFVLSSRNNVLKWLAGLPYQEFRSFHKWVGCLTVIEVLGHSIVYSAYVRVPIPSISRLATD